MTLDQYLKEKKELDIIPKLETRKANEGDNTIWENAVDIHHQKEEEGDTYFVGKVRCRLLWYLPRIYSSSNT